jgi:hypothetical protein
MAVVAAARAAGVAVAKAVTLTWASDARRSKAGAAETVSAVADVVDAGADAIAAGAIARARADRMCKPVDRAVAGPKARAAGVAAAKAAVRLPVREAAAAMAAGVVETTRLLRRLKLWQGDRVG